MKKVLVVGNGGREHGIIRALSLSTSVSKIYVSPGRSGMGTAETVTLDLSDGPQVAQWCIDNHVSLVVIGPEVYLVNGLADQLREKNILVFGPGAKGSRLEGSKIVAKEFMEKYNIPTSFYKKVSSVEDVKSVMNQFQPPYVLKADGLAGGKGVAICHDVSNLMDAAKAYFVEKKFGDAGAEAILEQFQEGYELSFFVLTNGSKFVPLPLAQDHKRLLAGDVGPNTGGMGAVAPMKISQDLYSQILNSIVLPTIEGFEKEKFIYRGVVFIGLMVTEDGPKVIEYNVRFGDPETQVILPLLDGDWGEAFLEIAKGKIPNLKWSSQHSCCVVLAAEGYPEKPVKGASISGDLLSDSSSYVLHAGTGKDSEQWVTVGGRVLNVVALAENFAMAKESCYSRIAEINFEGMQFRKDIGAKKETL